MKSTLMKKIGAALVVGMMAVGSVAPASAQESIMGNRRDNAESYDVGTRLYSRGFYGGRGYNRGYGGYNRGFRGYGGYGGYNRGFRGYGGYGGYNRPFLYNYGRPFYGPGYGYGYRGYNYGYPFAAGILGFGLGAILGGAINNYGYGYRGYGYGNGYSSSHVARCEARFRSYDAGTDSYMGYDGYRHRCNL